MVPSAAPTRPVLRWHGGKWLLAPWIIAHFPPHGTYVEPFGGAASVLLRKERSCAEIYNDLDDDLVALFRVLRSGRAAEFTEAIRNTPFSRAEFEQAYKPTADSFERARRLMIRSLMGCGSAGGSRANRVGLRPTDDRRNMLPSHDWANVPANLPAVIDRLRGVVIENRPFLDVIGAHDSPETLHYLDPPYLPETRTSTGVYSHEMTVEDHKYLLVGAKLLEGMVVISGYESDLYREALADWRVETRSHYSFKGLPRTEWLWINEAADRQLSDGPLFAKTTMEAEA